MQLTTETLSRITGRPANANMHSVVGALDAYGVSTGLDKPHRLAHYIPQLIHESGLFKYDREVWGPTPAQQRYDTRVDLGNTPAVDGDGKKNAGRGPIQLTGGANIARFYSWCKNQGFNPPDFRLNPDLINTDPWEGLSAIWYWTIGNPTGKSLNVYADENNIMQITKKINGGLNGYADRIEWYVKTALVLADFGPNDVRAFQQQAQKRGLLPPDTEDKTQIDGDAGPKTIAALHMWLAKESPATAAATVKAAPVVETKEVAVAPAGADKTMLGRVSAGVALVAPAAGYFGGFDQTGKFIMLGIGVVAVLVMLWKGEAIAARVRSIFKSIDNEAVQ